MSNTTPPNTPRQPFSWINEDAKHFPLADFAAIASEISHGIHACMEVVMANAPDYPYPPAAGSLDAESPTISLAQIDALHGLVMASSMLLRDYAEREIAWINEHGPAHMKAMKAAMGVPPE